METAFQADAFQADAFQITAATQSLGSYEHDASGYLYPRREADRREELEQIELDARDREVELTREAARIEEQLAEASRQAVIQRLRAQLAAKQAEQEATRLKREQAEAGLAALTAERNRTARLNRARREEEDTFFMLLAA